MKENELGGNPENMRFLNEGLKPLRSLNELYLNFENNVLNYGNGDTMRYLSKGLESLTKLKVLSIIFRSNKIGTGSENMKYIS